MCCADDLYPLLAKPGKVVDFLFSEIEGQWKLWSHVFVIVSYCFSSLMRVVCRSTGDSGGFSFVFIEYTKLTKQWKVLMLYVLGDWI